MKFRVLLVSEDSASVKMMQNILRHHRLLQHEEARSGEQAMVRVRDDALYHIILCDLESQTFGNLQVLQAAKSRSPDTRVIVIAGFGDHQAVIDAIKSGAYGYLHKPFRPEELNLLLNNLTHVFQQRAEIDRFNAESAELERQFADNRARIMELEREVSSLRDSLRKYEPEQEALDLNVAIARATAERTGQARSYNVFQELTNLGNLLEDRKINDEEYRKFRRTILEKAYQVSLD
jgi:DNA-binding NtrC family response regulator